MKKIIIITCLMLLSCNLVTHAYWESLGDGMYINPERTFKKGDYLYTSYKCNNLPYLNKILKEDKTGIILDTSYISHMTVDVVYDCKKLGMKTPLTTIYDKSGNIVNQVKDDEWDYTDESVKEMCELY